MLTTCGTLKNCRRAQWTSRYIEKLMRFDSGSRSREELLTLFRESHLTLREVQQLRPTYLQRLAELAQG